MSSVINTNVFSLNSQRALSRSQASMQTSLQRLSSGLRINSAKDDAAGLAISERFTAQIRGLEQANRNANDGISMMQTAEGSLDEIGNMLQRMRELSVQAKNGTVSADDKKSLDSEFQQLSKEITRTIATAEFNGTSLLSGGTALSLQVGFKQGANYTVVVSAASMNNTLAAGGLKSALTATISTGAKASGAISKLDAAINNVTAKRADFGAKQNRLESTVRNNANAIENQSAARSRIRDADFASETANLTRSQIMQQAGTAMLAQANQLPQTILSLLR